MTFIPPFITAKVINAQNARLFPGKGYVEKAEGNGNFVITLSSGKISVQCTPGSLSEGDAVLVKVQGRDVIIEKVIPQESLGKTQFVKDTLDLHQSNNVEVTHNPQNGDTKPSAAIRSGVVVAADLFSLSGTRTPGEGFYYFETIEKALSWLSNVAPGFDKKNQGSIPDELLHTRVVLQIVETEKEGLCAILLPLRAADSLLSYFVQEHLRSGLWNAFFPDGLIPALLNRQALSSERIIAIDSLFPKMVNTGGSFPTSENDPFVGMYGSMGKTGARLLCVQWLNIAMDGTIPPSIISNYPPVLTAAGLPPLVERIQLLQKTESNAFSLMPGAQDFSISQATFMHPQAKETIVPRILEGIGINYENALARLNYSDDAPIEMMRNLKHFLLSLESELNLAISQKSNETSENPLFNLSTACRAFSETWTMVSRALVRELFTAGAEPSFLQPADATEHASIPVEAATKQVFNQFQEWSKKIIPLLENTMIEASEQAGKVQSASRHFAAMRDGSASDSSYLKSDKHNAVLREITGAVDKLLQSITNRLKTTFEEIAEKINGLQKSFSSQFADLAKDALSSRTQAGGTATGHSPQEAPENMLPLHLRLRAQIHASMREIALQVSGRVRTISELIDQIIVQSSKLLEKGDSAAHVLEGKSTLEMTRRLVETALERIDSMQVSSKPTAAGDIRQQVVMVPMNIDGTWNDVLIKFMRGDSQGRKKNARKNILVTINVAPTFLGEINVSMNYKGIRDCSIQMDFDNDRTLSWFEKNRQGLIDAFVKLGFEGLKLNMQKKIQHRSFAAKEAKVDSNAAIDIVI